MIEKRDFSKYISVGLVLAFILSSCAAAPAPAVTATLAASPTIPNKGSTLTESPTYTPVATATPVPTASNTPTPAESATDTATPQSTPQLTPNINAYCRKGAGTNYDAITFLTKDNTYKVIGRDGVGNWWQVNAPGNTHCWVGNANVNVQGPVAQVSIVQSPPLPATPTLFVSSYGCDTTSKTLGVLMDWSAVQNVTGYRVYRNGIKLVELGADATSYHDDAPLGEDLVYELEAFNDFGVAARISTKIPACYV